MRTRVRCLLTDYAGVLSHPQDEILIAQMAGMLGLDTESFSKKYWQHRALYDRGDLTGPLYWKLSFPEHELSTGMIEELIQRDCLSWFRLNKQTMIWMMGLQEAGVRLSLFSNMPQELTAFLKQEISWFKTFEKVFFSSDIHYIKPHRDSYEFVLKELNHRSDEILFLDDREENIGGARECGLHGYVFQDAEKAAADLHQRFDFVSE